MKRSIVYLSFFLFIVLAEGCVKDFPGEAKENWKPSVANYLASGSLSISDLILSNTDGSGLEQGADQFLSIVYRDQISSSPCASWFVVPDQQKQASPSLFTASNLTSFNSKTYTDTIIQDTLVLNLSNVSLAEVDQIVIKDAQVVITGTSDFKDSIGVNVEIPGAITSTGSFKSSVVLDYLTTGTVPVINTKAVNIANTNTSLNKNLLVYKIRIHRKKLADAQLGNTINIKLELKNITYKYMLGKFVGMNIPEIAGGFNTDAFKNFSPGALDIEAPKITFNVRNSYGLPVILNFDTLSAQVKNGQYFSIANFQPYAWPINYPSLGQDASVTDTLVFTKANSNNMDNIIHGVPSKIAYRSKFITSNAKGYITDTSHLKMNVLAEFPLKASFNNLVLRDTLPTNTAGLNNIDKSESSFVRLYTVNGFPFDIDMKLYFYNTSTNIIVDSLVNFNGSVIKKGVLITEGKVSASTAVTDIPVTKDKLAKIASASTVMIEAKVGTGTQREKLYSDYKLSYNVAILLSKVNTR